MIGELQKVVGANVRRIRAGRGQSQESFAAATGYHRTYVGRLERGEENLTLRSLEELAARLAVDERELLGTEPR